MLGNTCGKLINNSVFSLPQLAVVPYFVKNYPL